MLPEFFENCVALQWNGTTALRKKEIQDNDIQHNGLNCDTHSYVTDYIAMALQHGIKQENNTQDNGPHYDTQHNGSYCDTQHNGGNFDTQYR